MQDPHPKPPPLPLIPLAHAVREELPAADHSVLRRFFIGAGIGVLLSILVWIFGWTPITSYGLIPFLMFPILKFTAGVVLLFVRRWRSFGAGILVSMALGVLIFGGMVIRSAAHAVANMPSTGIWSICSVPKPSTYPPASQPDDATTQSSDAATDPTTEPTTEQRIGPTTASTTGPAIGPATMPAP